jgi:polar amino acid transport system permease protein
MTFDPQSWWEWTQYLLPGLWVSVQLIVAVVVVGTPLAIGIAVAARARSRVLSRVALVLLELGRGVPALVMMYLVYFGLPEAGLTFGTFVSATIALSLNFSAYTSEVFRSALDSIDRGQWEASAAIGLSHAVTYRRVILPQAFRVATPPFIGWIISFFQATSLAFVIAVPELMSRSYELAAQNFKSLEVFVLAGILYAVLCIPGSRAVAYLEARRSASSSRRRVGGGVTT